MRQLLYGLGLVSRRLEARDHLERGSLALDAKSTKLGTHMARDLGRIGIRGFTCSHGHSP